MEYVQLFKHDSLGVGGSSKRISLLGGTEVSLLVAQISPSLVPSVGSQFASSTDSFRLTTGISKLVMEGSWHIPHLRSLGTRTEKQRKGVDFATFFLAVFERKKHLTRNTCMLA